MYNLLVFIFEQNILIQEEKHTNVVKQGGTQKESSTPVVLLLEK